MSQGKSWLGKAMGAFIEVTDDIAPLVSTVPQPPKAPSVAVSAPAVDEKLIAHLQSKITGKRTSYTSLLEQAEKLRQFIPDDVTRLKAAATANNVDKATIMRDIDVHVIDLQTEANGFKRFAENEAQVKVKALMNEAALAESRAVQNEQRIAALTQEITDLQATVSEQRTLAASKQAEANTQQVELDAKAADFERAWKLVTENLAQQKQALSAILV